MKLLFRLIVLLMLFAGGVALYAFMSARADPIVRRATVKLPDWPRGAKPVRVVLLSDVHIGSAAMDAGRLDRIVGQINALKPDLVLIAGDLISGHGPDGAARYGEAMVAPLLHLRAPLGVVAVPGNHDHWSGIATVKDQLRRAGVTVLANRAIVRGPLAIGGVDDAFTMHADIRQTVAQVTALPGARVLLSHSPDIAPKLKPETPLLLAGHTHCGQVVLPFYGPITDVSHFGDRYRCGLKQETGRTVVVTAGLGTSAGPFRLGAPPDLWLLTLGPI